MNNKTSSINTVRIIAAILILLAGYGFTARAQDLLKLKSGKELKVIIVEENESIVKYREFENQSGPVYTVKKENVESVKYKKGSRENQENAVVEQGKPAQQNVGPDSASNLLTVYKRNLLLNGAVQSARSVRLMMEDQPDALKSFDSAKKMFILSNSCPLIVMVISFSAAQAMNGMTEQSDKLRVGIPVLCVDGILIVAGILFAKNGKTKLKNSVALYNSSVNKPVKYTLNFGLRGNGLGLTVNF